MSSGLWKNPALCQSHAQLEVGRTLPCVRGMSNGRVSFVGVSSGRGQNSVLFQGQIRKSNTGKSVVDIIFFSVAEVGPKLRFAIMISRLYML
ncbi:hypothetical protein TNIN_258811 [Trichonephila inaurata madagascariensis]|uniref:Uncharacterized protein n=1 Tax=Trichonephila inaurata madagascariensis TaxID=2747483 RepID=A0A8X6MME9_9ARAC|nr:hypothetical protein TNIN_258811 [Trichonephila inaurata madagascariensis]